MSIRDGRWLLLAIAALVAAVCADAASPAVNPHDTGAELARVQAHMRAGEYRYAVAFAAHAASHRDTAEGTALYAWLLHVGGQPAAARRAIDEARERFPDGPMLSEVGAQIASAAPRATARMRTGRARLAPDRGSEELPAEARVAGNGVLIDGGRRALLPLAAIGASARIWVRNGLGDVARAEVDRIVASEGVAIARLDARLPFDEALEFASGAPFPGSVGFAVGHPISADAAPSWPMLASGFVGRPVGGTTARELGSGLAAGGRGGPVFDATGRLLGIALPDRDGGGRLVHIAQVQAAGAAQPRLTPASQPARAPVERIYESAMRTALQVIAAP